MSFPASDICGELFAPQLFRLFIAEMTVLSQSTETAGPLGHARATINCHSLGFAPSHVASCLRRQGPHYHTIRRLYIPSSPKVKFQWGESILSRLKIRLSNGF